MNEQGDTEAGGRGFQIILSAIVLSVPIDTSVQSSPVSNVGRAMQKCDWLATALVETLDLLLTVLAQLLAALKATYVPTYKVVAWSTVCCCFCSVIV